MSDSPECWQCGASLASLSLPYSRFDACRACRAELHVCRMCRFYDVTVAKHCREPIAEEVRDKQRANVCDYFSPRADAYMPASLAEQMQAKTALDALFGGAPSAAAEKSRGTAIEDEQAQARAALEALFKQ